MKKYGLLGEKLGHSYSPLIHNKIFEHLGISASYEKLECKAKDLKAMIDKLRNNEYHGYNVTIPYKKEVMQYLDEVSEEAQAIGSVNTIVCENGKIVGYNTDYYGFYNELGYYNIDVKNKDCYILGTGGASLAVYKALVDLGANTYYVSRTKSDKAIDYGEFAKKEPYLIVNTTPVGMYPNVNASPISEDLAKKAEYIVDIIFNPDTTLLMSYNKKSYNGLYMLVGQAIKAEELWQNKSIEINALKIMKEIR